MAKDPKENKKKGDPPKDGELDLSKLSDEQLNKVLEDPRIWKTPRLKKLRKDSKDLKKRKEADEEAEKDSLKKKGEFETLQKKTQKKLDKANKRNEDLIINNKIISEANKKGISDTDAVTKLIDRGDIKIDEDGKVTGITEAVDSLIESKPYLKTGEASVGNPTSPGEGGEEAGTGKFTLSQIRDSKFYQDNREAIQKAQVEGNIIDDRPTASPVVQTPPKKDE